jgi:hypothetical protein
MGRKIIRDLLIVAGLLLMVVSSTPYLMEVVTDLRQDREEWWAMHKPVEGDLVAMACLGYVPKFLSPRDYAFVKHPVDSANTDLYLWGDSYTWKIPDSAYAAVNKFTFNWRIQGDMVYSLDTTRKNILLFEITERDLRSYFSNTDVFYHVRSQTPASAAYIHADTQILNAGFNFPFAALLNKNISRKIDQNLEFNLFNYNFIDPVRKAKAYMNYRLFHRASGDVTISKNGERLFLKPTVQGKRPENSYYPVSDEEIANMVTNINLIYEHYRQEGFSEVYLSVIPNPATILQPEGSNQLIPRLESYPALKISLISMYGLFRNETKNIYRPGDTHWNNAGLQIWLGEVNKMLLSQQ